MISFLFLSVCGYLNIIDPINFIFFTFALSEGGYVRNPYQSIMLWCPNNWKLVVESPVGFVWNGDGTDG